MSKVSVKQPQTISFEYRQEKDDPHYGSCLWADFVFDLEKYSLSIMSDCGNFSYCGWTPTPSHESMLALMCRINADYLLGKIADRTVIQSIDSIKAAQEYAMEILEDIVPVIEHDSEELMREIQDVDFTSGADIAYQGLLEVFREYDLGAEIEDEYLWDCIKEDYPPRAKKICEIFRTDIQPAIREYIRTNPPGEKEATP